MKKILHNKKGMTLVEIIVSLAILAMVAVLVISVYASCLTIIGNNSKAQKQSKDAAAGIENTLAGFPPQTGISVVTQSSGTFAVSFSGVTIQSNGQYLSGTDADGKTKYTYFKPD